MGLLAQTLCRRFREESNFGSCCDLSSMRSMTHGSQVWSIVHTTCPTSTLSPSSTFGSIMIPSQGATTSIKAFSVSTSYSASPFLNVSPGFLCHLITVAFPIAPVRRTDILVSLSSVPSLSRIDLISSLLRSQVVVVAVNSRRGADARPSSGSSCIHSCVDQGTQTETKYFF